MPVLYLDVRRPAPVDLRRLVERTLAQLRDRMGVRRVQLGHGRHAVLGFPRERLEEDEPEDPSRGILYESGADREDGRCRRPQADGLDGAPAALLIGKARELGRERC